MGSGFSETEFKETMTNISTKDLTESDLESIQKFFVNIYNFKRIEDLINSGEVKQIKLKKPMNLMFLVQQAIDNIHDGCHAHKSLYEFEKHAPVSGSILFLTRFIPFLHEDRAFCDALFWKAEEDGAKCYGVKLAESLLHLLFKHEFTV